MKIIKKRVLTTIHGKRKRVTRCFRVLKSGKKKPVKCPGK